MGPGAVPSPRPMPDKGGRRGHQRDADSRPGPRDQRHPPAYGGVHQRRDPALRGHLWRSRRGSDRSEDQREDGRRQSIELRESIKAKVNEAGLWAPHLPTEYGGMGLDFLALAYMYEILAYAVGAATLFGIAAPNSGNASVLVKYGTEEQKRKWLLPLIDGTMESGFSMTEPDNAGSDPRPSRPKQSARAITGSSTGTSGSPPTGSMPTSSS